MSSVCRCAAYDGARLRRLGVALCLLGLSGGCGSKKAARQGSGRDAVAPRPAPRARADLSSVRATVLWRRPAAGAVRVLAVVGDQVLATTRLRGDRSSVRGLLAVALADGQRRWRRPARIRLFERNAPWTHSVAVAGDTLAVTKTADRVDGLALATGARRWRIRASGGVAAAGAEFVVADADRVLRVAPQNGKVLRALDLGARQSGAPGNGLMDALMPGTRLASIPGGVVLTRRHGGALQAFDATLAPRWRFLPPEATHRRPDRLVSGDGTLLVPVIRPGRMEYTRLSVWPLGGQGPALSLRVPGRVSQKRFWVTSGQIVGLSRTTTRQTLLYRIDRKTGKLVDARPFPAPHFCYFEAPVLACKRRHSVSGHRVDTLDRLWVYRPPAGRNIRSVRRAGGYLVLEVGADLLVLQMRSGQTVGRWPRRLDGKPYRVAAALGVAKGALVLAVRLEEQSTWGDRLLLLGWSVQSGKALWTRRLGRYPRPGVRPAGPVQEDAPEGRLPVVWAPPSGPGAAGRVVSLFDKVFQVVDAGSGRVVFARGIPGESGHRARWIHDAPGVAVFRRGRTVFGVSLRDHRVRWQASLFRRRKILVTPERLYVRERKGRSWVLRSLPARAPDPEAAAIAAADRLGCLPRWVAAGRWYCQGGGKLRVLDAARGTVLREGPAASNVFSTAVGVVVTVPERQPASRPSAWVGLDVASGAVRFEVAAGGGLPAPFPHETARPVRVLGVGAGAFWVSGPEGRCLHGLGTRQGKPRGKLCFGGLFEPPRPWKGWLLVTALSGGGAGGGDGGAAPQGVLLAVDPRSGARRVLFRPGVGKRVVLGDAGVAGDRLVVTVRPLRRRYRDNELVALRLQ